MNIYSLNEIKDKLLGIIGTPARDKFEFEVKADLTRKVDKQVRIDKLLATKSAKK